MTTMTALTQIPCIRSGRVYESLDKSELVHHSGGEAVAQMSMANSGLIRRDINKISRSFEILQDVPSAKMLEICKQAGELFMNASLPLGDGAEQSPQDYIESLSSTTGLPYSLVKRNMGKIHEVMTQMPTILGGLTRGLDLTALDGAVAQQGGSLISYYPTAKSLGVVLPSNSPGVNSIWIPAVALRIPVVLKPGREEPWTPLRIIQAFIAAGCPPEAFCFYPTDHEGANVILQSCDSGIIFGDEKTVARYASNPAVQVHGPGWSKILIGADKADQWESFIDVLAASIYENGGRSCVNASCVLTPKHGAEIADALAKRLAEIKPCEVDDENATLCGFANPKFAEYFESTIEEGLNTPGAEDLTARYRNSERKVEKGSSVYMLPTVVHCESFDHPLANREFLFPYASVVEVPQDQMLEKMGPSLVVTAVTEDAAFIKQLLRSPLIERLNLGALPTSRVTWDQPHEGNLFEFLYKRRAIQTVKK
ncbi:MAG: aldehyde dehydrogenase family protein [Candidatus Hinthialibacter antarcticus]|nr:aldehyde dehydrogenase family protein [Candidatus Hinthialibacter antarcticus]